MTVEPLTPQRFADLADAYGGTIGRWPEAVRAEALQMAEAAAMHALLERAGALDARLESWTVPVPSRNLADHIVALAPHPKRRRRIWWAAIGITTALAGAAAGSIAIAATTPPPPAHEEATAFGDLVEV